MTWQTYLTILAWPAFTLTGIAMVGWAYGNLTDPNYETNPKTFWPGFIVFLASLGWLLCK